MKKSSEIWHKVVVSQMFRCRAVLCQWSKSFRAVTQVNVGEVCCSVCKISLLFRFEVQNFSLKSEEYQMEHFLRMPSFGSDSCYKATCVKVIFSLRRRIFDAKDSRIHWRFQSRICWWFEECERWIYAEWRRFVSYGEVRVVFLFMKLRMHLYWSLILRNHNLSHCYHLFLTLCTKFNVFVFLAKFLILSLWIHSALRDPQIYFTNS